LEHHHRQIGDAGQEPGLRFALLFTPDGEVEELNWRGVEAWAPDLGFIWVHLERDNWVAQQWLSQHAFIEPQAVENLIADDSRPRIEARGDNLLIVLRGINHKIDCALDDDDTELVPLHIWAEPHRCITLRDAAHHLEALRDLRLLILSGRGPREMGPLLARITEKVVEHLGEMIEQIEEHLGLQEEQIGTGGVNAGGRQQISEIRRKIVVLRRFMAPQREALWHLCHDDSPWLCALALGRLRDVDAKLRGHLDNLDEMRQRAALLHEEIAARVAEQTNRNTLLMSIVSVIMLPMTFVTGYFGMNTGGLPFNSDVGDGTVRASVAIVCVGVITALGTWLMLRPPRR
jgi:zinc transporter